MNLRAVALMLGQVLFLLAAFLCVPALVAWGYGEMRDVWSFLVSAGISAVLGALLCWTNKGATKTADGHLNYFRREGLAVVGLVWLLVSVVGGLPFLLSGVLASPVDALFEAASGFTTTGSTVMTGDGIDGMPKSIAFWRSFTHWLGGFGIVMVFVVLFPTGGRSLFRSEIPGIAREAGHHRVRDSAIGLLRIYFGLSAIQFFILWGMMDSWFDAAIHTFGTLATGGFSNYSDSVAHFDSFGVELVIVVFMLLAGINFAIYDIMLRKGPRAGWRGIVTSLEAKTFLGIVFGATVIIGFVLWLWGGSAGLSPEEVPAELAGLPDYRHLGVAMRDSLFQVVCLQTSTGYGTADFNRWPEVCRMLLMMICVIGACAGSTGGGIKVVRILIVAKAAVVGVSRFVRPRAIHSIRIDGQTLDPEVVSSVTGYFALWILVFLFGTTVLSFFGIDPVSSSTAVLATLNNIGPGLNLVGPTQNFGEMPDAVKLLLSLFMILGRLEFYAVAALFVPGFWKK